MIDFETYIERFEDEINEGFRRADYNVRLMINIMRKHYLLEFYAKDNVTDIVETLIIDKVDGNHIPRRIFNHIFLSWVESKVTLTGG